jgi:group I intron endonuclease
MAVIYQITNMLTGDFYIGSSVSFERRVWQHRYALRQNKHKNPHMQASWNKYGDESFVFEILEQVPDDGNVLAAENKYLHKFVGRKDCFNINPDAERSRLGTTLSKESREKISLSRKGKHGGENHYRYGQTVSNEVREKISASQKGRASPMKGKKMSEQGRLNVVSAIKRGSDSHFYGKRPTNAEDMQRAVTVRFPNNAEQTFASLTYVRDTYGVSIATLIRACKSRNRIERGIFSGHFVWYADESPIPVETVPEEYKDLPRTRTEAKRLGAKKYFTGQACTNGHVAARYTKGQCVVCAADEQRARSQKDQ